MNWERLHSMSLDVEGSRHNFDHFSCVEIVNQKMSPLNCNELKRDWSSTQAMACTPARRSVNLYVVYTSTHRREHLAISGNVLQPDNDPLRYN